MAQKISITRRFQFCAGHRVFNHESKCRNPHGHNYILLATVQSETGPLDSLGRVIDFSVVKNLLGKWIDENWDHGFIFFDQDSEMRETFANKPWKNYSMKTNPTAENMALHILEDVAPLLFYGSGVEVVSVEIWETENCKTTVHK